MRRSLRLHCSASPIGVGVVILLATAGCGTPGGSDLGIEDLRKAIITKELVDEAIAFEESLGRNSARLPPEGTAWFTIRKGGSRVLITAPHATRPTRKGQLRSYADHGTGSLAEMVHRLTGATAMYTTYASPSDPAYYDDNEFKRSLAKLIEERRPLICLDLHVSHWNRPYDLDIGTMNGDSLQGGAHVLNRLLKTLQKEGVRNLSSNYFSAGKTQTITKFVSSRGVPCVQLEFSSTLTSPSRSDLHAHRYAQLLQALVRFVREVDDRYGQHGHALDASSSLLQGYGDSGMEGTTANGFRGR